MLTPSAQVCRHSHNPTVSPFLSPRNCATASQLSSPNPETSPPALFPAVPQIWDPLAVKSQSSGLACPGPLFVAPCPSPSSPYSAFGSQLHFHTLREAFLTLLPTSYSTCLCQNSVAVPAPLYYLFQRLPSPLSSKAHLDRDHLCFVTMHSKYLVPRLTCSNNSIHNFLMNESMYFGNG